MEVSPSKIIEEINTIKSQTHSWRDRLKADALHFTGRHTYSPPKGCEDFRVITTALPALYGQRVVGMLSGARPSFSFKYRDEAQKGREELDYTELFAISAMDAINKYYRSAVTPGTLHDAMSYHSCVSGSIIPLFWLKVGDNGELLFDGRALDPYNTYWSIGSNGKFIWQATDRWITKDDAEQSYPDIQVTADDRGMVKVTDYINNSFERCIIGEQWADKPYNHNLGYVPSMLFPSRATPVLQFDTEDMTEYYGDSIYAPVRHLIDALSEQLTMYATLIDRNVNAPFVGEYDSDLGGKPEVQAYPGKANSVLWMDVKAKQKMEPPVQTVLPQDAKYLNELLRSEWHMGTLSPISYGQLERVTTAASHAMALQSDVHNITPFKRCVETSWAWMIGEAIRQYKKLAEAGKVTEWESAGVDTKGRRFEQKFKGDDLVDKREITCELDLSSQFEEMQNVEKASLMVREGLASKRTARDVFFKSIIPDSDSEAGIILTEALTGPKGDPVFALRKAFNTLQQDKKGKNDSETKFLMDYIAFKIEKLENEAIPKPETTRGQGMAETPEVQPPADVVADINRKLGNIETAGI